MNLSLADLFLFSITTVIATLAFYSSGLRVVHRRVVPWTGGVLIGVSLFWVVPDVAEGEGWPVAVTAIAVAVVLLTLIDQYIYPVCPLCALGMHNSFAGDELPMTTGYPLENRWPLLIAGCLHNFFDGGMLAFAGVASASISSAISWGFAAHKIPEAFVLGLLANKLTNSRKKGLKVVLLVQSSFMLGSIARFFISGVDPHVMNVCIAGAGATLLFFGLSTLRAEWRVRGAAAAFKVGTFGIGGCGVVALLVRFIN